jgi:hypothetical protein
MRRYPLFEPGERAELYPYLAAQVRAVPARSTFLRIRNRFACGLCGRRVEDESGFAYHELGRDQRQLCRRCAPTQEAALEFCLAGPEARRLFAHRSMGVSIILAREAIRLGRSPTDWCRACEGYNGGACSDRW